MLTHSVVIGIETCTGQNFHCTRRNQIISTLHTLNKSLWLASAQVISYSYLCTLLQGAIISNYVLYMSVIISLTYTAWISLIICCTNHRWLNFARNSIVIFASAPRICPDMYVNFMKYIGLTPLLRKGTPARNCH